jgi:hypothetical protein
MNYECHITINCPPADQAKLRDCIEESGWYFSSITGDPDMGLKTYAYATNHYQDEDKAITSMLNLAYLLEQSGYIIQRRKVEQIVYDDRLIDSQWVSIERPCAV